MLASPAVRMLQGAPQSIQPKNCRLLATNGLTSNVQDSQALAFCHRNLLYGLYGKL